jgi:hypothetical protein
MLGVFVAYFVTIVIFAGLYLMVNKVGEHYNPAAVPADGGGGGENPPTNYELTAETLAVAGAEGGVGGDVIMADVGSSFCGMDINNHMEGECQDETFCLEFVEVDLHHSVRLLGI